MGGATLAKDIYGNTIQTLYPDATQAITILAAATAYRNSTDFTHEVLRVVSTVDCFIKLGGSTIDATTSDHYLPMGTVEYFRRGDSTRISVITATGTGAIYISGMM